jgi:hypothetical protein
MRLTTEGKQILRDLIDEKIRRLLDWKDFLEDAGVPVSLLQGYMHCEHGEVLDEHLADIAHELGISASDLFGKLRWETPADDGRDDKAAPVNVQLNMTSERRPLEKAAELERRSKELLELGDTKGHLALFNDLWDLLDASEDGDERRDLASRVAGLLFTKGLKNHDSFDFLGLCSAYNDACSLVESVPESLEAALACVNLALGVFEMKFTMREFDNVESYIDELLPITARFAENETFTMQSAACLSNLLQLCPYDRDIFISKMIEVLDGIGELADRFPGAAMLQLCYMRSLVFFLCYGQPRLKDEIYERYYELTNKVFADRQGLLAAEDLNEMRRVLAASEIVF